jgi:hypothetical protein
VDERDYLREIASGSLDYKSSIVHHSVFAPAEHLSSNEQVAVCTEEIVCTIRAPERGFTFKAMTANQEVDFLVDTGATCCVVAPGLAAGLEKEKGPRVLLTVANGNAARLDTYAKFTICRDGVEWPYRALIGETGLTYPLIVGLDFQDFYNVRIDVRKRQVTIDFPIEGVHPTQSTTWLASGMNGLPLLQREAERTEKVQAIAGAEEVGPGSFIPCPIRVGDKISDNSPPCIETAEESVRRELLERNANYALFDEGFEAIRCPLTKEFLREYRVLFPDALHACRPPKRPTRDHQFEVLEGSMPCTKAYPMPLAKMESIAKILRTMEEGGLIERVNPHQDDSMAVSPAFLVCTPGKSDRLVNDFRAINALIKLREQDIPTCHDVLTLVGQGRFFTVSDMMKGYFSYALRRSTRSTRQCRRRRGCISIR